MYISQNFMPGFVPVPAPGTADRVRRLVTVSAISTSPVLKPAALIVPL